MRGPSLRSLPLQTEAAGPTPDDTFGPFRVLHQIGAGVLGPVFRAYDPESDRLVAVKLFRLDLPPERVHQLVAQALEQVGAAVPVRRPYTAPERIGGTSWDRRADVFSLAALMHEMLWGRRLSATGAHVSELLTKLPDSDLDALRTAFARGLAE